MSSRNKDRFADQLFRCQRDLERLESMLRGIVEEELGLVFGNALSDPDDQSLMIEEVGSGVRLSVKTQARFWDLGFKRVTLLHEQNSWETPPWDTYYYCGGDPNGYRKIRGR